MPQIPMTLPIAPAPAKPQAAVPERSETAFSSVLDTAKVPGRRETVPEETARPTGVESNDKPEAVEPEASEATTSTADALAAVIEGLSALRSVVESGAQPDPELLENLTQSVQKLADALGLKLEQAPTPDKLAAIATRPAVAGEPMQAELQKVLAPLAQSLLAETEQPEMMALGERLGALVVALGDTAPDETVALASDIAKAATSLPKATTNPQPSTPETATLAEAEVKIAEPGLSVTKTEAAGTEPPKTGETKLTAFAEPKEAPPRVTKQAAQQPPVTIEADAPDAQAVNTANAPTTPEAKAEPVVAAARPVQPGYQTSQQQLNLPQLAFELVRQVHDGHSRFQVRLDPAELGRIDVKLDIDANGQVHARLTVERAETLDLMQRDQRGLEKALQQAGLDSAKTNLEFSLKQNGFGQNGTGDDTRGRPGHFAGGQSAGESEEGGPTVNLYRGNLSASGVNMFV